MIRRSRSVYVAIELSRKSWVVAAHLPTADKISRYTVEAGKASELLALIERLAERVEQKLGNRPSIVSCFEAGSAAASAWHRQYHLGLGEHAGLAPIPAAEAMIRVLLAYCDGESKVCSVVQVPTIEQEDARRPHRERLVAERIQHVNRIQGLLATQGIHHFRPMRCDWEQHLEQLFTGDGAPLPVHLAAEVRRECRWLALVIEMLAEVEVVRDEACSAATAGDPIIEFLQLRGIGPNIAMVLGREVFYRDFVNRRALACGFRRSRTVFPIVKPAAIPI